VVCQGALAPCIASLASLFCAYDFEEQHYRKNRTRRAAPAYQRLPGPLRERPVAAALTGSFTNHPINAKKRLQFAESERAAGIQR
jgi:hypothetical protein